LGGVVVRARRNATMPRRIGLITWVVGEAWAVGVGQQAKPGGPSRLYGRAMDFSGQLVRRHVGDSA
jgi:hypothetical protein